jgi:ribonuclease HII
MRILAIDEAGRGPVIGPMVICGYLIEEDKIQELKTLGVKDSKLLSPEKREALSPLIRRVALDFITLKIPAGEIDSSDNLNSLEIEKFQHIINTLNPDKVVIDSPEVNTKEFAKKVMAKVKNKRIVMVAENYADKKYPEVGAASIIAKTERDREIRKLHQEHGYFGSGYPSDEITIRFLKDWIKRNKEFPNFVRKSWSTAERMKTEKEQKTMGRFLGAGRRD